MINSNVTNMRPIKRFFECEPGLGFPTKCGPVSSKMRPFFPKCGRFCSKCGPVSSKMRPFFFLQNVAVFVQNAALYLQNAAVFLKRRSVSSKCGRFSQNAAVFLQNAAGWYAQRRPLTQQIRQFTILTLN